MKKSIIKFILFSLLLCLAVTPLLDDSGNEDPPYQGSRITIEYFV